LNSTLSVHNVISLAKDQGLSAVALTDAGNLHGAVEFTQAARAAGIKPILGAELLVDGQVLRVYVENARGYANLCGLLSEREERRSGGAWEREEALSLHSALRSPHSAFDGLRRQQLEGRTEGLLAVGTDPRLAPLFPNRF